MVLVTSLQDRLALEIGAQIIARHRIEIEADGLRERIVALEASANTEVVGRANDQVADPGTARPSGA